MQKKIVLATAALLTVFATSAFAVTKGSSIFAIQLSNGTADLYDPHSAPGGYISAFEHNEIGVRAQFWKMLSDDYAFNIAGDIGFFGEENKPGTGASPGSPTRKYTQSSFLVRVGGDRVVNLGERTVFFIGPGLEFWSGKNKFEGFDPTTVESESVSRISLSGRMGGLMRIGSNWGLGGDMGHKVGRASAEDRGAEATWWASSFDAHGGVFFSFGGN